MSGIRLHVNEHKLEVQLNTLFSPIEVIRYDGREMSRKSSWFGTVHSFEVDESGGRASYEVSTHFNLAAMGCVVRRNGSVLYETF